MILHRRPDASEGHLQRSENTEGTQKKYLDGGGRERFALLDKAVSFKEIVVLRRWRVETNVWFINVHAQLI